MLDALEQSTSILVPRAEAIPQIISLVPILLSGALVMWKRSSLPYPRLWTGALIGISFATARHACAIEYLQGAGIGWLYAYNVFLCLVPVTMLVVSWAVMRSFERQKAVVDAWEQRYRTALSDLERRLL